GRQGDREAELLQIPHQPPLAAPTVALVEVVAAELLVRRVPLQEIVANAQDAVADGDGRFLLAQARDQPMILCGQVAALLALRGLPGFDQRRPQPLAALARLALLAFAG